MRYLKVALASVLLLTGCTRAQVDAWVNWYNLDAPAAVEFANQPEIQAQLHEPEQTSGLRNNHAHKWDAIAMCESGQNWHLRASNRTGTYGGGLMIRDNVWVHYGGREFAPTADKASKAEQIEIAERILADVGWQAWDCA